MREVVNYSQWDLSEKGSFLIDFFLGCVLTTCFLKGSYLLDVYDKLYVWYGTQCSETMKQSSILVANTYIRLAATVREMYVGLELFMSGAEPLEFQWVFQVFGDWIVFLVGFLTQGIPGLESSSGVGCSKGSRPSSSEAASPPAAGVSAHVSGRGCVGGCLVFVVF